MIVLSLVILVVIASNVILWSYQMNQLDWEKMQEDLKITNISKAINSSWFTINNEYTLNQGSLVSGNYVDTENVDGSYETFREGTIAQTLYLQRVDVLGVTPAGKLMNATQPPSGQSEIKYQISRGGSVYFYTAPLLATSIEGGTWTFYIWASTESSGKVSYLTIQINLVTSDGSTDKATIGVVSDFVIDYGYSERAITIVGAATNASSGDRLRLTLYAQTGGVNDSKGMSFYYDGCGVYQTLDHETRLQSPSPGGYKLDFNGSFAIDTTTYPTSYVRSIEIQVRYRANDPAEKWYLKAYNWTSASYGDNGFNSTLGHSPSTGWDCYAVNLTDQWQSYLRTDGTINIRFRDANADGNQTIIDVDFLAVRVSIDGAHFSFNNKGALTCHIVSIWVVTSTTHRRYEANAYVNTGESLNYIRADVSLPNESFFVKITSERGNMAVYSPS